MIGCAECRWFFVGEIACALRDKTQTIVYVSHAIDGECFGCDAGEMVCGTDPPEDVGEFDCIIRFCWFSPFVCGPPRSRTLRTWSLVPATHQAHAMHAHPQWVDDDVRPATLHGNFRFGGWLTDTYRISSEWECSPKRLSDLLKKNVLEWCWWHCCGECLQNMVDCLL